MRISFTKILIGIVIAGVMSSCGFHTQHYMFRIPESKLKDEESLFEFSEDNYILQINDWLNISVYTNDGEILIDPNNELSRAINVGNGMNNRANNKEEDYLVLQDGTVRLPLVGYVQVDGRSIVDVEFELQQKFAEYYVEPYVRIKPLNKRVLLFTGQGGKVIPLANENMNLLEVLALGGQVSTGSNAENIRIIRGDLRDPEVLVVDLSTVEGLTKANLRILPNDVIYVQAKRNALRESVQDIAPVAQISSTLITLYFTITRIFTN